MAEAVQDFAPRLAGPGSAARIQRGAPRVLGWATAIGFMAVIAGAAFAQIQILLLGGNVLLTPAIFKALMVLVLGVAFFARGGQCVISLPVSFGALVLCGLGISIFHVAFSSTFPVADLLVSDFLLYFLILLGCAYAAVPLTVSPKLLTNLSLLVFFASFLVAVAQYVFNNAIVATYSADGKFRIHAAGFYGHVRGFGLFHSPLEWGSYCCLIGNFAVILAVRTRHRYLGWMIVAMAGFGCFVSITRTATLCYLIGLPMSYILARGKPKVFVRLLPLFAFAAAVFVFGYGLTRLTMFNKGSVTSSETFSIRYQEWTYYVKEYRAMPFADQLLGHGLIETSREDVAQASGGVSSVKRFENEGPMTIDNTFIALLVNSGFMGLVLFLTLYVIAWKSLLEKAMAENASTLMAAAAATFATLPFTGTFGVDLGGFGTWLILANILAY